MDTTNLTSSSSIQPLGIQRVIGFSRTQWVPLAWIVVLGIFCRFVFVLIFDQHRKSGGGDTVCYLQYGLDLVTNKPAGISPAAPTFLVYVGLLQLIIPADGVILVARLL